MKEKKFDEIKKANESIVLTDIKGKNYAEVNQRIKAFRMLYPEGFIETNILSLQDGVCVMKTEVGYYLTILEDDKIKTQRYILGTGTAYEKENASFINKTSYIENCETSSVGRALAMCGIGIDTSIASADEVENAINQQKVAEENKLEEEKKHQELESNLDRLIATNKIDYDKLVAMYSKDDIHLMSNKQLQHAIENIDKFEKKVEGDSNEQ